MDRKEIITELKNYFNIKELVCQHIYKAWGEKSWQFLDTELLHTILVVRRDILKGKLICNNEQFTQRGLRCNLCQIVIDKTQKHELYLSAHVNGAGFDFDASGMGAESARLRIKSMSDLLPYPIRLEANVNWVHLDVYDSVTGEKVTMF